MYHIYMNHKIRFPERTDLSTIADIERKCHAKLKETAWSEQDFIRFFGSNQTRAYVLEEGEGNVVGFILLNFADEEELVITRLSIHPDYRRSGFGSHLLSLAVKVGSNKLRRSLVTSYVEWADKESQNFYSKNKFQSKISENEEKIAFSFILLDKDE